MKWDAAAFKAYEVLGRQARVVAFLWRRLHFPPKNIQEYSCLIMDAYQTHTLSTIWKHFSKIPIIAQLDAQKHICSYMQMSFRVWWRPFAGSKVKPKSLWLPLLPSAATSRSKSDCQWNWNGVFQDFSTNQRRSLMKFGSENHDMQTCMNLFWQHLRTKKW